MKVVGSREPRGQAILGEKAPEDELGRIGAAEEPQLASLRCDGTMHPYVTMWVVRTGDDLYVRSAYGPEYADHVLLLLKGRVLQRQS